MRENEFIVSGYNIDANLLFIRICKCLVSGGNKDGLNGIIVVRYLFAGPVSLH